MPTQLALCSIVKSPVVSKQKSNDHLLIRSRRHGHVPVQKIANAGRNSESSRPNVAKGNNDDDGRTSGSDLSSRVFCSLFRTVFPSEGEVRRYVVQMWPLG